MFIQDQLGNTIEIGQVPKRAICLVPSLTELLVDLGLENNIVGVTKFCVHPKDLKAKKIIVGGTKSIKLKKIQTLQPDFILCNKEENTKEIVESCKTIAPTFVSDIYSIEDVLDVIDILGKIFTCSKKASEISSAIQLKVKDFSDFLLDKKAVAVTYIIWKKPWMVAANQTFINHLLEVNGFINVFSDRVRYPEITIEELNQIENLEYILLSSEPYPFQEKDKIALQNTTKSEIHFVDGEYFSWYGSRLLKAFEYFKELHLKLNH